MPVNRRAALGVRSEQTEVNLALAALRKVAVRFPAVTARLVSVGDTAHRVAGTPWGMPLAVVEAAMSMVLTLVV